MNPFKVGDKVKYIGKTIPYLLENGKGYIVMLALKNYIGFNERYFQSDKEEGWVDFVKYEYFEIIERFEDIPFNNQMEDIVNE